MARARPQWVAKHDDQKVPEKVQLRIADRQRPEPFADPICHCCGQPISDGQGMDLDHVEPLIAGGKHAESNLRAVHRKCHRMKTAREAHERAEYRARQKSALGIRKRGGLSGSRIKYSPARNVYFDRFTGEVIEDMQ